jgi:hypothetical protein
LQPQVQELPGQASPQVHTIVFDEVFAEVPQLHVFKVSIVLSFCF